MPVWSGSRNVDGFELRSRFHRVFFQMAPMNILRDSVNWLNEEFLPKMLNWIKKLRSIC